MYAALYADDDYGFGDEGGFNVGGYFAADDVGGGDVADDVLFSGAGPAVGVGLDDPFAEGPQGSSGYLAQRVATLREECISAVGRELFDQMYRLEQELLCRPEAMGQASVAARQAEVEGRLGPGHLHVQDRVRELVHMEEALRA